MKASSFKFSLGLPSVTLILAAGKMTGLLSLSWMWVLSPFWLFPLFVGVWLIALIVWGFILAVVGAAAETWF